VLERFGVGFGASAAVRRGSVVAQQWVAYTEAWLFVNGWALSIAVPLLWP
jgi:hypothetical protein